MIARIARGPAALLALTLFAVAATSAVDVRPAAAQEAEPTAEDLAKAKDLYLEGKALFEKKKFADAVEKFKESYKLSRRPALLLNIALTFSELDSTDMALFYYKKFLTDSPNDAANAENRATAEKAVKEIEAAKAVEEPKEPDPKEPDPKEPDPKEPDPEEPEPKEPTPPRVYTIEEFEHEVVDEAPPNKPLDLIASPHDAQWKVILYYRPANSDKFVSVVMKEHHKTLVARIPAKQMTGNAVQYYIEVKDDADQMLTRIGKATSPNVVYIDEAARPQYYPDFGEDGTVATTGDKGNGNVGMVGDDDNPPGFGEEPPPPGGEQGNPFQPEGSGFTDVGSSKFKYAKWGTTGAGIGLLGVSITFGLMASSYAASLEAEAAVSNDETCSEGNPCRTFDEYRRGIQDTGERYELISRVALGFGVVAAGVASYLWYKELKAKKRHERGAAQQAPEPETGLSSLVTAPLVGQDLYGAAAALRF